MNFKKPLITALFVFLLSLNSAYKDAFSAGKDGDFEEMKAETIDAVIVPDSRAAGFYSGNKIKGYFTPSREDILKAEPRIIDYLIDNTPQSIGYPYAPDIDKKLANYKRQYVGVIFKNNERKIWINFFCNAGNDSWKSNPFSVIGGGACYFNLLYDIDSGEFSGLRMNGVMINTNSKPSSSKVK